MQRLRAELPELSFEEAKDLWHQIRELQVTLPDFEGIHSLIVHRAESLLLELGFEDTDDDGLLNWPEGTPLAGKEVDVEIVITDGAGIAIGFVPVVGDAVDGAAFLIGKDPYTGECFSQTEQILVALAVIPFLPISVKSVKFLGKQVDKAIPLVKRAAVNWLPKSLPLPALSLMASDVIRPSFRGMRKVAGEGAASSGELASFLGVSAFSESNYRRSLIRFTGIGEDAASKFEAHHILPKEFEERFVEHGIETIHDPRLLVWVDPDVHRGWSKAYSDAWNDFFEQTPNPTRLQILEEARELAEGFGYEVLFEIAE